MAPNPAAVTRGVVASVALTLVVSLAGSAAPWSAPGQPSGLPVAGQSSPGAPAPVAWQSFEGSLSASGRREALAVEDGRTAVALRLSGTLVLTRSDGLGKGFRAEFLGFDDGSRTGTARAVWTDDAGDKIFSRMVGAEMQTGRRSAATITGGTGRYAHVTGTYTFTWQYVMSGEQGAVQARIVSMKGRYRLKPPR